MIGIDLDDLARRATAAAQDWAAGSEVRSLVPLEGGTVSLVYAGDLVGGPAAHDRVVLKVAPPGFPPTRNRDVLRQGRCMRALDGQAGVAVPEVLFVDEGVPNDIPPFVATAFVAGECIEPILVAREDPMEEKEARARSFAAVEMLAALHRVRPSDIGLGAEPITSPTDEVDRWTRTFDTVPDDYRIGFAECAAALRSCAPAPVEPAVVHGDYRLGNMLASDGTVRSIIDWEIWSVSDPRIDLSWLLFFTDEANHPVVTAETRSGVPSDVELLSTYEDATGAPVADLWWFDALTRYKEAAAMALIAKHLARNEPDGEAARGMAALCPSLIADARERVERGDDAGGRR